MNGPKYATADYLSFLQPPQEALVLYQDQVELDHILFNHVKSGLDKGDKILYLVGTRSVQEVQNAICSYGIDVDFYSTRRDLTILTYDDMFLVEGMFDIQNFHTKLSAKIREITGKKRNNSNRHCNIRLVTESNWWLWANIFEKGLKVEETHPMVPPNVSSICTYRLQDLLDYVRVYHVAKLIELHRHALLATSLDGPLMHRNNLLSCIRDIAISSIHELGLSAKCSKRTGIEPLSVTELIQSVADQHEAAELEFVLESQLRQILKV